MIVPEFAGMQLAEVFRALDALDDAGVAAWLEGGWGVDALVGHQTRPHRDVDVDIDVTQESIALAVLDQLGYEIESDWRPNRVELVAPGRGWVDVHPLLFDGEGNARQTGLDGECYDFPASYFTHGQLAGRDVRCFSLEAQRRFHTGYDLRAVDHHDLALLEMLANESSQSPD